MTKCNKCGNNTAENIIGNYQSCTVCDGPVGSHEEPELPVMKTWPPGEWTVWWADGMLSRVNAATAVWHFTNLLDCGIPVELDRDDRSLAEAYYDTAGVFNIRAFESLRWGCQSCNIFKFKLLGIYTIPVCSCGKAMVVIL
jgi:hypothetical protein